MFDTLLPSYALPETKWFGHKYSPRHRKPNKRAETDKHGVQYYETDEEWII
tara:strand:- start:3392 stop:3544 length:153 start_codon:yes stop_codon:yes gene_type:complete